MLFTGTTFHQPMAILRVRRPVHSVSKIFYTSSASQDATTPPRTRKLGYRSSQHLQDSFTAKKIPAKAKTCELPASPLSTLSNGVLARSLFINFVASNPWLLSRSILFLSLLCHPSKSCLFNVNRNKLLAWILKETIYKQFCAGETMEEVRTTMRTMKHTGFHGTILTYAQETVFDYRTNAVHNRRPENQGARTSQFCWNIQAWRNGTLSTIGLLGEGDQLAVKLTGAGPLVTEALAAGELPPQQMLEALEEICVRCQEQKARILIDAESQCYQSGILRVGLDLSRKYNRDGYAMLYNTYQAYLKSTRSTLAKHLATALEDRFTLGLKLVRGAYLASDPRHLIHDTKQETDDTYNGIAQGALRQELGEFGAGKGHPFPAVNLMLAGHNRESVFAAYKLHQQRSRERLPTVPIGFAQLQGMSDEISFGLLQLQRGEECGPEVYKCSTWGSLNQCLAYLARRATENREAASRTVDAYTALKAEARRRLALMFTFSSYRTAS